MKLWITMKCRYEWRRIRNGEKIIVDKGLAEPIVELVEGDIEGESNWVKLNRLLDQVERDLRKQDRADARKSREGKK